ncbi:MAG: CaiB/BaiF CoA transferase family protein [Dehalococcoidia bacterium]
MKQKLNKSKEPLSNLTIIEFGNYVAGPWAGQLLADMGATVIKIEPLSGDPWRKSNEFKPNESKSFISINRGVKSFAINLKSIDGQKILSKLIKNIDGVISNNRIDTSKKLKIDYNSLKNINSKIIYVEITGYGSKGDKSKDPGFDTIMQGYTGTISGEGKVNGHEIGLVQSTSFIDFSTGYAAVNALLAGIIQRSITGKGQKISTSLLANALGMQSMRLIDVENYPSPTKIWFDNEYKKLKKLKTNFTDILDSYNEKVRGDLLKTYYRVYTTLDGAITLGALAGHARISINKLLKIEDARLKDITKVFPKKYRQKIEKQLQDKFNKHTTNFWLKKLHQNNIPCESVRFIEELLTDKQALINNNVIELKHHTGEKILTTGPVLDFNHKIKQKSSPKLGENNKEILSFLGYKESTINKYRKNKTIL